MKKDLDSTHVFQNGTGQQLIDSIEDVAKRLSTIAIVKSADIDMTNYEHIQKIVQLGMAKDYFEIGDQIHTTWKPDDEHEYDMPWDVVDFGPCEDPDGNIYENAMWLQSHYTVIGPQFSQRQAVFAAEDEMPAGTYHFMFGAVGKFVERGTFLEFTTTKVIPKGSILLIGNANNDVPDFNAELSEWRLVAYENNYERNISPIEIVELTIGENGLRLKDATNNALMAAGAGLGRWSQSAVRQWLNSDKPAGEWWEPQSSTDKRPIASHNDLKGFIAYLPKDFISISKPISVMTKVAAKLASNENGDGYDRTIDHFILPSAYQMNSDSNNLYKNEGKVFDYWKTHEVKAYMLTNQTRAEQCGTRSSHYTEPHGIRRHKQNTWQIGNGSAYSSYVYQPVCVIY